MDNRHGSVSQQWSVNCCSRLQLFSCRALTNLTINVPALAGWMDILCIVLLCRRLNSDALTLYSRSRHRGVRVSHQAARNAQCYRNIENYNRAYKIMCTWQTFFLSSFPLQRRDRPSINIWLGDRNRCITWTFTNTIVSCRKDCTGNNSFLTGAGCKTSNFAINLPPRIII